MSPQPNQPPEVVQPATPKSADDPLAPPDDFGAAVVVEFAKRAEGEGKAVAATEGAPPGGGWPANDDAPTVTAPGAPAAAPVGDGAPASDPGQADAGAAEPKVEPTKTDDTGVTPAAPVSDGGPDGAVVGDDEAGSASSQPAPSGYTWRYEDKDITFADADVQRALSLAAWAEQLPEDTRAAIGSIETGQAVAIPRADYDAFRAWQQSQARTTRDADLANLDVDENVTKLLVNMRDEIDTLKGQGQQQPLPSQQQQQTFAALDETAKRMNDATVAYAQARGITAQEAEALLGDAVRAEVIPSLMQAGSTYNPATGALLHTADIAKVTEQALDFALVRNPALHSRVIAGQNGGAAGVSSGAPAAPPPVDPVAAKRARASSLATAPSGAAPPAPETVKTMTNEQRVNAMARDIEAALAAQ